MSNVENSGVVVAVKRKRMVRLRGIVQRLNPKNLSPRGRKASVCILLAFILFASLGTGFLYVKDQRSPSNQCNGREDSQIYRRAGQVMNPAAVDELGRVVGDMEQMRRFRADPTCLYIATVYNLDVGRYESSREYYDLLKDLGSAASIIQVGPESIKTLEQLDFEITKGQQRSEVEYEEMKRFSEAPDGQ